MVRRCGFLLFVAGLCLLTSCQRAQQYKAIPKEAVTKAEPKEEESEKFLSQLSWIEPAETPDTPIVFVPSSSGEWPKLAAYWNALPFPGGLPTVHLGLPPMQMAAAWALVEHHTVIKIKVPRGLLDPTPNFPPPNPPTLGKWRLGKKLFFTPMLTAGSKKYSCATCHDPRHGFAEDPANPPGARYNTPSLINVAYNRRQFWDGRVRTLEEALFQSANDERRADPEKRLEKGFERHVWGGFARALAEDGRFHKDFIAVLGVQPTQDAVAQALATYLRTILAGDSLYDRAEQVRRDKNAKTLTAAHFAELVKDEVTAGPLRDSVSSDKPKREEMPMLLVKGHELFHGKARCARCHQGPLFTDDDFHNIGCDAKESWPLDKETGRAVHVPIGLKEARLIGAFRTPSLRNLEKTYPYFHHASGRTLRDVVDFYDIGVLPAPYLAKTLKDGERPQSLLLSAADRDALVIFLRSLQGQEVDSMVMRP